MAYVGNDVSAKDLVGLLARPDNPNYKNMIPPAAEPAPLSPVEQAKLDAAHKQEARMLLQSMGMPVREDQTESGLILPEGYEPETNRAPLSQRASHRVVIMFGRNDKFSLAAEESPAWEVIEGSACQVSEGSLREMLPILQAITKIKDMTGCVEEWTRESADSDRRPKEPPAARNRRRA